MPTTKEIPIVPKPLTKEPAMLTIVVGKLLAIPPAK